MKAHHVAGQAQMAWEARRNSGTVLADPNFAARAREIAGKARSEGVEAVYFQVSSVDGRILGKLVAIEEFVNVARRGIRLHYGALVDARTNVWGELIGFDNQEVEGVGIPDLDTFSTLGWDQRFARVWCNFYHEFTGEVLDHDVRANLLRAEAELESYTGLRLFTGIEPEMMWLKDGPGDALAHSTDANAMYQVSQFDKLQDVFLDVLRAGRAMGLDMSHGDHEDASQLEFNQAPAVAMRHADDFVTYRQICRMVGRRHGYLACFMPKPFMGTSGNGHHHHISLVDEQGNNAFAGDLGGRAGLSQTALWSAGGLLEHAGALTLVGAPTVNSYKRFWDIGYWAPFLRKYGYQNRTVILRVPAPGRFEIRQFDSSCNPYLTLAGIAYAVLDGIKRQIDPGDPYEQDGSGSLRDVPAEDRIPLTLDEAIDAFEDDGLMKEAYRPALHRAFLEIRRDDLARYNAQVSQWELDFYLRTNP